MRSALIAIFFLVASSACVSDPAQRSPNSAVWKMPYSDDNSQANPHALGNDMAVRKDMPHRTPVKNWEFYYKYCAMNGDSDYYSATSYDCSGPF